MPPLTMNPAGSSFQQPGVCFPPGGSAAPGGRRPARSCSGWGGGGGVDGSSPGAAPRGWAGAVGGRSAPDTHLPQAVPAFSAVFPGPRRPLFLPGAPCWAQHRLHTHALAHTHTLAHARTHCAPVHTHTPPSPRCRAQRGEAWEVRREGVQVWAGWPQRAGPGLAPIPQKDPSLRPRGPLEPSAPWGPGWPACLRGAGVVRTPPHRGLEVRHWTPGFAQIPSEAEDGSWLLSDPVRQSRFVG